MMSAIVWGLWPGCSGGRPMAQGRFATVLWSIVGIVVIAGVSVVILAMVMR